jgi:hypothetical protein
MPKNAREVKVHIIEQIQIPNIFIDPPLAPKIVYHNFYLAVPLKFRFKVFRMLAVD